MSTNTLEKLNEIESKEHAENLAAYRADVQSEARGVAVNAAKLRATMLALGKSPADFAADVEAEETAIAKQQRLSELGDTTEGQRKASQALVAAEANYAEVLKVASDKVAAARGAFDAAAAREAEARRLRNELSAIKRV